MVDFPDIPPDQLYLYVVKLQNTLSLVVLNIPNFFLKYNTLRCRVPSMYWLQGALSPLSSS